MKKDNLKSQVKAVKKAAKQSIKLLLVSDLKRIASEFGDTSKKIDKQINKRAEKLANKISKELKIDKKSLASAKQAHAPNTSADNVNVNGAS